MQIHHLLEESYLKYPDRETLWYNDCWYSYKQINDLADAVASYLVHRGILRGDRVAILLKNSFHYVSVYFGILKAGAVVVSLNTETNTESLIYLLNDSESSCVISQKKYDKYLLTAYEKCPMVSDVIMTDFIPDLSEKITFATLSTISREYTTPVFVRSIDLDLAEIVYTSGSTAKPKGVMLSHLNLVSNMRSICKYLHLTKDDRVMVVLPFYYIYGKSLLLTHIMMGASLVIANNFVYPNNVLKTMIKTAVTGFAGVPSTFMILLNRSSLKNIHFENLRYVTQAGGAMAPAVQKEVVQAFSPAVLYIMYGATEAAPRLSYLEPEKLEQKIGSIGIPVDNVDLKICDKDGHELPCGEIGEIAARGANIMMGYWKDPEETNQVLKQGLYFTGDLGKQDEDGFFYVLGRRKDIIKVKGFRVGAKEIEEIILEIEDVLETAVIGIDDPISGEAILALVIPKQKNWNDLKKIRKILIERLPPVKRPKYIELRDSFPKNESGKILKAVLKDEETKRRTVL